MHVTVDDDVHDGGGLRLGGRQEHGVDDVDHAIVGGDVGDGDLGVVDEDAIVVDGHRDVSTVERGGGGAVGQIGGQHLRTDHVVQQDVGEAVECEQVLGGGIECGGQGDEGVVGRCEDGERTVAGEGFSEPCSANGGFQQVVDVTVDDDIDDSGGRIVSLDNDGSNHALRGVVTDATVVVVGAGDVESDGAHAIAENPPTVIGGQ